MLDRYLAALPAMSLIPFAPFFTADFLAPFFALLLESPAVCYAIRYGKARPLLHPRYGGISLALESVEILEWVARRGRRAEGKERARRIPAAGCNESATTPSACLPRARRVASLLALAGVARWAEIAADIGAALTP